MTGFAMHPTLLADTLPVRALPLSDARLMNDARYPWVILVPRRPRLTELYELSVDERSQLSRELNAVSCALVTLPEVSKVNVASLGNVVAQLHVHVVGRHPADPAWPGPVWGHSPAQVYAPDVAEQRVEWLGRLVLEYLQGHDD